MEVGLVFAILGITFMAIANYFCIKHLVSRVEDMEKRYAQLYNRLLIDAYTNPMMFALDVIGPKKEPRDWA